MKAQQSLFDGVDIKRVQQAREQAEKNHQALDQAWHELMLDHEDEFVGIEDGVIVATGTFDYVFEQLKDPPTALIRLVSEKTVIPSVFIFNKSQPAL